MTENTADENFYHNELHVKHLLSATKRLYSISSDALLCHWNILLGDVMQMKKIAFSKREKDEKINCMYCLSPWRNGMFSIQVLPKPKPKKKLRKLVRMVEAQKKLSKVQKKLAKAMHLGPTVVVNCKICHKSTKFKIPQKLPSQNDVKLDTVCASPIAIQIETENCRESKKKKKKRKSKQKNFSGLNPVVMEEIHCSKGNKSVQQDGNETDKSEDDDVIVIENIEASNTTERKSRKRKVDDSLVMEILEPESEELIRIDPDGILANSLPITPLGMKQKQCVPSIQKNQDFIPLETSHSTPKRNDTSMTLLHNKGRIKRKGQLVENAVHHKKPCKEKSKKNLSKWKRLITEEESKPSKTSSLKDFLSTL